MYRRGPTTDALEKAKRAVSAFRSMQPTLNSYARNLTGRPDVRVEVSASSNGSTDGKRIFYRPPIELGNNTPHNRSTCNKRDEALQLHCPACKIREDVLVTIYHEIGHIWSESFAQVSEESKNLATKKVIQDSPTASKKFKKKMQGYNDYQLLSNAISPYFGTLVNALEDVRVDTALFKALPGTEVMFRANVERLFTDGVEQMGEEGHFIKKKWGDYGLNSQIILGVLCVASGYRHDFLSESVQVSLADEQLNALIKDAIESHTASDIFKAAFPIFERLQEMGYLVEDKPEPPPPAPEEEEPEDGDKSDDGSDYDGDQDQDGLGDDGAGSLGEGGGDDEGSVPNEDSSADAEEGGEGSPSPDGDADGDGGDAPEREDGADGLEGGAGGPGDDSRETGDGDRGTPKGDSPEPGKRGDDDHAPGDDSDEPDDASLGHAEGGDGDGRSGVPDESGRDEGDSEREEPGGGSQEDAGTLDRGDEEEVIDRGEYSEGTEVKGTLPDDSYMGSPEEVEILVAKLGGHDEIHQAEVAGDHNRADDSEEVVSLVVLQGEFFEMPSANVMGVKEYNYTRDPGRAWDRYGRDAGLDRRYGARGDFTAPETIVGPATLKARVVFADNARGRVDINKKRGKIRPSALGRRAPVDDYRMFQQKTLPGRKSYHVLIGIDISGSTIGENIILAKKLAMVEAEMLGRLGISFEIWAHSAGGHGGLYMNMYEIKGADEPWNPKIANRLATIGPDALNLDGHTMEFYRKRLDRRNETHKILHYYTDGAMPAENHDEELVILQREIKTIKQRGYLLTGVGIRTDSPIRHGLETVRLDEEKDIQLLIANLGAKLARA